jgi:undecaprenyl-diphosphatase
MSATGDLERSTAQHVSPLRRLVSNVAATFSVLVRPPRRGRFRLRGPSFGTVVLGIAAVIAAVAAAMFWLDGQMVFEVRRLPIGLIGVFDSLTNFGRSGWILIPIGTLLVVIAVLSVRELPRLTRLITAAIVVRLMFLFVAIGAPGLFVSLLKRLIGRARPHVVGDGDVFVFKLFVWRPEYASMPSGHGTTAFAAVIAIGALWPRSRPLMWAYAAVIAVSRIVVSAHYSSDVIASAAFGVVGALLVRRWFAVRRLGFAVGPSGIRRLPGPSFRRTIAVARRLLSA